MRALRVSGAEVYWLDGGGFRLDGGSMFGPVARPRWMALYPPADDNSVALTAHVLLVHAAGTWGLVDAGFGHHLDERQRRFYSLERNSRLAEGLAEVGIGPGQLDWLVLTHLHLDHAGGALDVDERGAARPAFPNARVVVQQMELEEALDETNRAHGVYPGESFERLRQMGVVQAVDGEADVVPGLVRVMLTGGHSRGHQGARIGTPDAEEGARGEEHGTLLHLGDLLVTRGHLPPAWVSALDDYPLASIRAKQRWLGEASRRRWWVGFSHDVAYVAGRLDERGRLAETLDSAGAVSAWPPA